MERRVSVATQPFDLVIEGSAERVTDARELTSVAEAFVHSGWPAEVAGNALTAEYSASSAGPPPWDVQRVKPSAVRVRRVGSFRRQIVSVGLS